MSSWAKPGPAVPPMLLTLSHLRGGLIGYERREGVAQEREEGEIEGEGEEQEY